MDRRFAYLAALLAAGAAAVVAFDGSTSRRSNRVDVLIEGYVRPIDGREFLPGATDHGARRVASTIGLVRAPGVTLGGYRSAPFAPATRWNWASRPNRAR